MMKPREAPHWRLLRFESGDPRLNLAVDEAILKSVETGLVSNTLRLWRNPRSVVLGVSEEDEDEVDLDACKRFGVQIVRRFTGGGTVYQDGGNLNWTVVVKREPSMFSEIRDISEIFWTFAKPISIALGRFGLKAELRLPASILVDGMKISGMAASIKRGALLCHSSLLVNSDLSLMRRVLKNMKYPVANLRDLIGNETSPREIGEGIVRGFEHALDVELVEAEPLGDELEIAKSLI